MRNERLDFYIVLFTTALLYFVGVSAPLVREDKTPDVTMTKVTTVLRGDKGVDPSGGADSPLVVVPDPCGLADVICPPEAQKRIQEPLSVQSKDKSQVFKKVCSELKIEAKNCWKTLYAMHMVETGGNCKAIGDHGQSRGCFQIKVALHKISVEKAEDLYESAKWTLRRMISFNYPQFYSYSVRRHNGWGKGTLTYLARVNEIKRELK